MLAKVHVVLHGPSGHKEQTLKILIKSLIRTYIGFIMTKVNNITYYTCIILIIIIYA